MPRLIEWYLMGLVEMETDGTEARIPKSGPVVVHFCPHSGWMESVLIDKCFERVGRPGILWMTKAENSGLPRWLLGDRFIAIDRDRPEPSVMRILRRVLTESISPAPALGTAIEGTRFGNPDDPEDVRTLGDFKTGLMRVAMRTRTPIVAGVTLDTDTMATNMEEIYKGQGTLAAFRELGRLRANRHPVRVRILPPYTAHFAPPGESGAPDGPPRVRAEWHVARLREQMVAEILALEPDYPTG
jgi:1-acyl-sn-glycerol-3-phosphate acyltransferase